MRERVYQWIAWRLPARVVYWAALRVMASATQGRWSRQDVTSLTGLDALARWRR